MVSHIKWHDSYEDGKFQLAVIDEVQPDSFLKNEYFNFSFLLQWIAGDILELPRRCRSNYKKMECIGTIILSNYSPRVLFGSGPHGQMKEAAFNSRVTVVHVEKFISFVSTRPLIE